MANVSHASLTGSNLHEPKGVSSATIGTVYVANGAGSGSWTDVGTASFTGMIADFITPVAPSGWLECDGTTISTSTFSSLYNVMVIHNTGTRTNGSPIITSVVTATGLRVGFYIFGTGFASGTTIVSIDSATQITVSNNASSSGTAAFDVSPWLLNTGTIKLPDLTTAGRFRRSRTASATTKVGDLQADQNQAHTHSLSVSGTTSNDGSHTHTINISDPGHTHFIQNGSNGQNAGGAAPTVGSGSFTIDNATRSNTTGITASSVTNGNHQHTVTSSGTSGSTGSAEARPLSIVVLTCVKI